MILPLDVYQSVWGRSNLSIDPLCYAYCIAYDSRIAIKYEKNKTYDYVMIYIYIDI